MNMKKEVIAVDKFPRPTVPYSYGVKAGNLLFIAGQVGVDPANNKLRGSSISEQTEQALTNMANVLKAAGSFMEARAREERIDDARQQTVATFPCILAL